MSEERVVNAEEYDEDTVVEMSLRPQFFSQYIGQSKVTNELEIYIQAAKKRSESLDHVLLYGPPGLGKTTLAMVIANELGVSIRTTSGPAIEKSGDLVALLNELEPGDVLFIDEIHRMPRAVEEILYSAMEDFYIDIMVGQGSATHPVHFPLPPFTLIGATTRAGMLSAPLRDRFGIISHMEYYNDEELKDILLRSADVFSTTIEEAGAFEIARRSRGTPRIANRLLKRVRDYSEVKSNGVVSKRTADEALELLRVDELGLDHIDQKLLHTMIEFYNGGPVGLTTLSINIGEDKETVEDMYEPYLIQRGFIKRTARGRVVTEKTYSHFNIPFLGEN